MKDYAPLGVSPVPSPQSPIPDPRSPISDTRSSIPSLVQEYLSYLETARGVSARTLASYGDDLSRYATYCGNHGIDPEKASSGEVQGFIADLSFEKAAPASINRRLSSIRGFYRWLVRFGRRVDNPCDAGANGHLRNVKVPRGLPTVLWQDEMAAYADLPETKKILWPARDKALILTVYSAGLRVSELASLSMKTVNGNLEEARVMGKGGKERIVFFSDEAKAAIQDYLPEREAKSSSDALFVSRNGRPLSVSGIRWIVTQYTRRSGLGKNIHPHSFRHSFATHLVNNGCDVRVVQEMMGHASLSTTQRYAHVNIEGLKKVYKEAHPHGRD